MVLAASGHSCGSSSSSSAKLAATQDTFDELQIEMAKQLSQGRCQGHEESENGVEQGSENNDDSSSAEESHSDDTDTDQEYAYLLHFCEKF